MERQVMSGIGNRVSSARNNRAAAWTPNLLNQYDNRTVPGFIDVLGEAHPDATVTVNAQPTQRAGRDFRREIPLANAAAPVYHDIIVEAVIDSRTVAETRRAFAPRTPEAFTHDADGNLASDGRWTYEWDGENRLRAMQTRPDVAAMFPALKRRLEFSYDHQGRRIRKVVKDWNANQAAWKISKDLRFVYDGWNLIEERDALNGGAVVRKHVWGPDLSGTMQGAGGVGGLLWTTTPTQTFAASSDANGNIVAWINTATLAVAGRADYSPFGEPVVQTGIAKELPFGFSTKYEDTETGLLYYGFRYLNPTTGRWLNRDPIEELGGLNLYGFVGNDPVNHWDYLGLSWKDTPRGMWMEAVERYLRAMGYRVSEHLFVHSLQDNPADLFFPRTHFISRKIKGSQEFQELVDRIVYDAPTGYHELSTKQGFNVIQFTSNSDLSLSIHWARVEYEGVICKISNSTYFLDLTATIKDDYDFHLLIGAYRQYNIRNFLTTVANNMAWTSQIFGVINAYSWEAEVHERRLRLWGWGL